MQLLVSAANAADALAALDGGAQIVDAKDPAAGALGAVARPTLRAIHAAVAGARPVTAALGDAADEAAIERHAHDAAADGAALVKIGFAGIASTSQAAALLAAAARGAGTRRVVAVAYADSEAVDAPSLAAVLDAAVRAGVRGVLVDTARKRGPGLLDLVSREALATWVRDAHAAGLLVALAGRLSAADLARVRDLDADVAGVRGAACDGGRGGQVSAARVRHLRTIVDGTGDAAATPASAARLLVQQ